MRAALADWLLDGKPVDSVLEKAMRRLITTYGLPPVEFHPIIAGHEPDFRIVATPIVLECDGWEFHGRTRAQHDRDVQRDNDFKAAGFLPVHFTYRQIMHRPAALARRLRELLERWAPDVVLGAPGLAGETRRTRKAG